MAVSIFFIAASALAQHLTITNPLNVDRTEEVIEIPLADISRHMHGNHPESLVVVDASNGKPLPSQLFAEIPGHAPDRLLVLVHAMAHASLHLTLREEAHPEPVKPLVFGREATERKDDFAWENLYTTYRVYGPALQATGEIASGIDVWSKRVPNFVIDSFYQRDMEGARTGNKQMSYHIDNGVGLDSYEVGHTRGCGGTAVFSDGRLWTSKNYSSLKMIASGPIRFAFEVNYAPWDANGVSVSETKRISLDAGSRLNKIVSIYTFGGDAAIDIAAGLAVHKDANAEELADGLITSVWDTPQLASAGRIATGMVSTQPHTAKVADGNELMIYHLKSGEPFHYAAGSGWSQADMPDQQAWNKYLKLYLLQQQHPLTLRWK